MSPKPSARRQVYLDRYKKEPPVIVLKRSRTHKVRRSPLPGVFSFLHTAKLGRLS